MRRIALRLLSVMGILATVSQAYAYTTYYDFDGSKQSVADIKSDLAARCSANTDWTCGVAGKTRLGVDIDYVEIAPSGYTQTVFIDAGIHGKEPQSVISTMALIKYIDTSPASFSQTRFVIVPVLNPDGYTAYTQTNGVANLNRNTPSGFRYRMDYDPPGYTSYSRSNPKDEIYLGPSVASEPEIQAIMWLLRKTKPNKCVNFHAGANTIISSSVFSSLVDAMKAKQAEDEFTPVISTYSSLEAGTMRAYYTHFGCMAVLYESTDYLDADADSNILEANRFISAITALVAQDNDKKWDDRRVLYSSIGR